MKWFFFKAYKHYHKNSTKIRNNILSSLKRIQAWFFHSDSLIFNRPIPIFIYIHYWEPYFNIFYERNWQSEKNFRVLIYRWKTVLFQREAVVKPEKQTLEDLTFATESRPRSWNSFNNFRFTFIYLAKNLRSENFIEWSYRVLSVKLTSKRYRE